MNISKLSWKMTGIIGLFAAGILTYSCNNKKSEKNSTSEADSSTISVNPNTNTDTSMGTRTTGHKKTGKVSVAMAPTSNTGKMTADKSGYYNYAEVAPSFTGGQKAIEDYVNNNLQYPQAAIDNDVQGTVNVQFGIDDNGNISNVTTIGPKLGSGLEEEAIRVVSGMSKWNPGTVKGKNVKTWMVLPITYRIEE